MKGLQRLYDLDGTLVNTNGSHVLATEQAFHEFALPIPDNFFQMNSDGVRLRDILADMNLPQEDIDELRRTRDMYHIAWLLEHAEWFEGAEEILERQRTSREKIAIVTNSTDAFVDAIDQRLGIRSKTDLIITTTTPGVERGKPDPTGIKMALQAFDIKPEQSLYIGDQGFDIKAAKRAEIHSCLIRGSHTRHIEESADYEISHIKDLLKHIA